MILNDEVNRIFITHKDRLMGIGFEYVESICNHHNVEIVVIQSEHDNKSVEQELEKDIKSLLATLNKEKLSNMSNVFTITTELKLNKEYNQLVGKYISDYIELFNKIQRLTFIELKITT